MSKLYRQCPACHQRVAPGERCRCGYGSAPSSDYADASYKRNRQAVIDGQLGRCGWCGDLIAVHDGPRGQWRMLDGCGVHHKIPLRCGGSSEPSNLVGLCQACHVAADSAMRREG